MTEEYSFTPCSRMHPEFGLSRTLGGGGFPLLTKISVLMKELRCHIECKIGMRDICEMASTPVQTPEHNFWLILKSPFSSSIEIFARSTSSKHTVLSFSHIVI